MRTAIALAHPGVFRYRRRYSVAYAMKRLGEVRSFSPTVILRFLGRAFREGWMWIGIAAIDPGVLLPARLAFLGGGEFCASRHGLELCYRRAWGESIFLGEQLTPLRWAGIGLVSVGVALVCLG